MWSNYSLSYDPDGLSRTLLSLQTAHSCSYIQSNAITHVQSNPITHIQSNPLTHIQSNTITHIQSNAIRSFGRIYSRCPCFISGSNAKLMHLVVARDNLVARSSESHIAEKQGGGLVQRRGCQGLGGCSSDIHWCGVTDPSILKVSRSIHHQPGLTPLTLGPHECTGHTAMTVVFVSSSTTKGFPSCETFPPNRCTSKCLSFEI